MSRALRRLEYRRPRLRFHGGGEAVHQARLAAALEPRGIRTHGASLLWPDLARGADVVHVFGLQDARESLAALRWAAAHGLPAVLTAITGDPRRRALCLPVAHAWLALPASQRADHARALARGGRLDELPGVAAARARELAADRAWQPLRAACARLATRICCLSQAEAAWLQGELGVPPHALAVTPVGTDVLAPAPAPPAKDPCVLVPASRLEPLKNQLAAVLALRDFPHPVVFTGAPLDPTYAAACRALAGPRCAFPGLLAPEALHALHAAARVVLHPSWLECASLALLDAAALGSASIVASLTGSEQEYFGDLVRYADPACPSEIRAQVEAAWEAYEGEAERRAALAARARAFTWEAAAEATAAVLREAMAAGAAAGTAIGT